jgi:hypothetical protein
LTWLKPHPAAIGAPASGTASFNMQGIRRDLGRDPTEVFAKMRHAPEADFYYSNDG